MESISSVAVSRKIRGLNLKFITPELLASLLNQSNTNTVYKALQRLEKYKILTRLDKGKYLISDKNVSEFEIANFLVQPSYVSLESALVYYGILPQFTYTITSVTTKKAQKVFSLSWEFEYSKTSQRFFWGYENQNGILIASPEKACLDYLYLASKRLRNPQVDDWDLSSINKKRFKFYAGKFGFAPLQKLLISQKLI